MWMRSDAVRVKVRVWAGAKKKEWEIHDSNVGPVDWNHRCYPYTNPPLIY